MAKSHVMTVHFIFTVSTALTNVCIAFFTTPASVGEEVMSGKYLISLALAEGDMLAQNELNPGISDKLVGGNDF